MAHWVGKLNLENGVVIVTGKTKEEAIREIGFMLTNRSKYQANTVENRLRAIHEQPAITYGSEGEEIAKVFSCNCGSIKRHLEKG